VVFFKLSNIFTILNGNLPGSNESGPKIFDLGLVGSFFVAGVGSATSWVRKKSQIFNGFPLRSKNIIRSVQKNTWVKDQSALIYCRSNVSSGSVGSVHEPYLQPRDKVCVMADKVPFQIKDSERLNSLKRRRHIFEISCDWPILWTLIPSRKIKDGHNICSWYLIGVRCVTLYKHTSIRIILWNKILLSTFKNLHLST